jgi:ATP-dependent HslUV protease subunit HslV
MEFRGTTICAVKRNGVTAIAGDGQVTMGESVIFKNTAIKVRRIFGGKVILGFAGSVTDAFALTERFEGMLNKFSGNLMRSAVELAELWRSDKIGRKLDAMMITADENTLLILSGTGEVIEPDEGVCAIGSGGNYALAAARALYQETDYDAETIAKKALKIASEICVFTNDNIRCETVGVQVNAPLPPANEEKTAKKRVAKSKKENE